MKHILCIHLLNWPIDRLARRLRLRSPDGTTIPSNSVMEPRRHGGTEARSECPSSATHQGGASVDHGRTDGHSLSTAPPRLRASSEVSRAGGSISSASAFRPLLIVHAVANRQMVVAADADALRLGIRPGQTLTEARIHWTDLLVHPWRPADDARGIESLGRYLMRFTPVVATATCDATDLFSDSSAAAADCSAAKSAGHGGSRPAATVYLDLTGCEHLFGGLETLLCMIAQTLNRLRIFARMAVAPNPAAAYALTFSPGGNIPVTQSGSLKDILAPLPIDCLRLDDHALHLLHQLGVETIGQLLKLPRNQLASRFGRPVLQRIGQALGEIAEPLVPLPCGRPVEGRMDFEGPVGESQAMEEAFRRVLDPMIQECYRRGQGFRELRINLPRPQEPPLSFSLELSRPTRNPKLLLNLFRCAMEQQQQRGTGRSPVPGSSGRGTSGKGLHFRMQPPPKGEGVKGPTERSLRYISQPNFDAAFLGLQLSATRLDSLGQQQASMVETDEQAGMEQWHETLDRLRIRFGPDSIVQAQLVESHLPEHAFKLTTADEPRRHGGVTPSGVTILSDRLPNPLPASPKGEEKEFTPPPGRRLGGGELHPRMQPPSQPFSGTMEDRRFHESSIDLARQSSPPPSLPQGGGEGADSSPWGEVGRGERAYPSPLGEAGRGLGGLPGNIVGHGNTKAPPCRSSVAPHRPLLLLPTPQEIRVTVSPSDDRDGRPIQFSDEDGFHRVVHWVGPERISGEWWEGRNKTRDYFDVEDEAGRRQWIFRVQETGRWFLHGVFA